MTQLAVGAIPAVASRLDQLAMQLAGSFADLAGAPATLAQAAAGEADALALELADLVNALEALVRSLLSLAGRAVEADASYSTVERELQASATSRVAATLHARIPWPREPDDWRLVSQSLLRDSGVAATLGLEALLGALPRPVAQLAALLGDRVPDGPGWARAAAPPMPVAGPTTAADLLSEITQAQTGPGRLALTHLAGTNRWVVALPGIHSLLEAPDPLDLPGALAAFSTGHGAYARSVVDALTAAGVPLGSQLLIVGHSQGGIVAADLAADPQVTRRWQITDVLAAAAPIGGVAIPATTRLLAMDNADDIVPSLDMRADAPRPDRTTIRFRDERGSIGSNHDLAQVYTAYAHGAQFTGDPRVRRWLLHAAPYLSGGPATTQLFDLRDQPPVPGH